MYDVLKSSRFWVSTLIILLTACFVFVGKMAVNEAVYLWTGLLGGFGLGKTGGTTAIANTIADKVTGIVQNGNGGPK